MAYVKQNFTDGSKLYASNLNHIEDGIADNNTMVVTFTDDDDYSVDKLAYDIYTAHHNGRRVICDYGGDIYQLGYIYYSEYEETYGCYFVLSYNYDDDTVKIWHSYIFVEGTETENTYVDYSSLYSEHPLTVNFTKTDNTWSCDKLASNIYEAVNNGRQVFCRIIPTTGTYFQGSIITANIFDDAYYAYFLVNGTEDGGVGERMCGAVAAVMGNSSENTIVSVGSNINYVEVFSLTNTSESGGVITGTSSASASDISTSATAVLVVEYNNAVYKIPYTKTNMSGSTVTSVEFNTSYLSSSSPATLTCINGVITGTNATVTFTTHALSS